MGLDTKTDTSAADAVGVIDFVLGGDLAYSNSVTFDALVCTLQRLCTSPHTLWIFAHRHRKAASQDLIDAISEHFIVLQRDSADTIDPRFRKVKHNISIFTFRRKSCKNTPI